MIPLISVRNISFTYPTLDEYFQYKTNELITKLTDMYSYIKFEDYEYKTDLFKNFVVSYKNTAKELFNSLFEELNKDRMVTIYATYHDTVVVKFNQSKVDKDKFSTSILIDKSLDKDIYEAEMYYAKEEIEGFLKSVKDSENFRDILKDVVFINSIDIWNKKDPTISMIKMDRNYSISFLI